MKRLIKKSSHDILDRDSAILFINGEIYSSGSHAAALKKYLIDYEIIKNDKKEWFKRNEMFDKIDDYYSLAFAHKVDNNIYLEVDSLINTDLDEVIGAIKYYYPSCKIYKEDRKLNPNDENYQLIAKIKSKKRY